MWTLPSNRSGTPSITTCRASASSRTVDTRINTEMSSDSSGSTGVQPVTVIYTPPPGRDPRFYGWWGDMDFAPSLLVLLAQRPQGSVRVVYHPPLKVGDFADRKTLAAECERIVRAGMPPDRHAAG